jgi:transcriptional regulator with XRE-family HTH domain
MTVDTTGRRQARAAVGDQMVRLELGPYDLARKAGVDPDTVADFVNGRRWPQTGTRAKIAQALGWTPETIDRLARGEAPARSIPPEPPDDVAIHLPAGTLAGLAPAEREEAVAAARLRLLERVREIRRGRDT